MEFIMLIGLPGSGKSTYAKKINYNNKYIIHSSDELRKELFSNENFQCNNRELFNELHKRIINDLNNGNSVIYDATNINYKKRIAFLEKIKHIDCKKSCIVVATTLDKCLSNNANRDKIIPEDIINRMWYNFYFPCYFEGWDDIKIKYFTNIYNIDDKYTFNSFYDNYQNYNQNNQHHSLTLYEHCFKAYTYLLNNNENAYLILAGFLHDCGKPFVATNSNKKGETTKDTHYYNHNNISAYESMFYLYKEGCGIEDIVKSCSLIQWHMQPYFNTNEKLKNKWLNKFGKEFYKDLMTLHEADKYAH